MRPLLHVSGYHSRDEVLPPMWDLARSAYDGGRLRPSCLVEDCGFFHYGDYSIGADAVVLRGDRVLLIERRMANGTFWQTPGGYVESDEEIHTAVEREVLEETGVTARVVDVVGFRHSAGVPDRPTANIYIVFR